MADHHTDETLQLHTEDGVALVAELRSPAQPSATAVICHPHPQYGGDMYNNVVGALFDHLSAAGVACLRFNFRGGGGSGGRHGGGRDEQLDVVAAIDELASRWPDLPLVLAGYSFGADVTLAVTDERISGWLAVAPPLRILPVSELGAGLDPRPKRIVTGSADDFCPPASAQDATAGWNNHRIDTAEGANHFFMVGLDAVRASASDLLVSLSPS